MNIKMMLRAMTLLSAMAFCPGCPEPPSMTDGGADLAPQGDLRPELAGSYRRIQRDGGAPETFLFQRDGKFFYDGPEERLAGTYQLAEGQLTLEFTVGELRHQLVTSLHVEGKRFLLGAFTPQGAPSGVIGAWSQKAVEIVKDQAGKETRQEIDETLRLEEGGKATLSGTRVGPTPLSGTYARESKDGESPAVYVATFPSGEGGKDPPFTLRLYALSGVALGEQLYERE